MEKTTLEKIQYMLEMITITAEIQFGTYVVTCLEVVQGKLSILIKLEGHVIPTQEKIDGFIEQVKWQWLTGEFTSLGIYVL